ncbi:MAG TPA: hypothetical protein VMW42_06935, partial [Desulfatiglandales bacterium]|nr:hypothetical protein [Desulfatiglandales bacterium]
EGRNEGEFYGAEGIVTDTNGYVYVADTGNSRVQKFTSDGEFVTMWGSYGTEDGEEIWYVTGIATDSEGNVYVSSNYQIQKFTSEGVFITMWQGAGTGEGEFRLISGIAVNSNDQVYVTELGNHRIQVFSKVTTATTEPPAPSSNSDGNRVSVSCFIDTVAE